MKLDGKTALITGGASGIGKATVLEFARCGARVICADVNGAKAAEVTKEAVDAGLAVEAVAVDLADPKSARRCAAEVIARSGRVDLLVNAAGWNDLQPFIDNTSDYMDRVIAVNLGGPVHLTQALLPPMIAAGKGKIINVSSDAGRVGSGGETVYAAAKGGVIAFTKSLAREVARYAINVNCVCPGPTDTPALRSFAAGSGDAEKVIAGMARAIPMKRLGTPEDIGPAVAFLASDGAGFVTGQTLAVSGGLTMA